MTEQAFYTLCDKLLPLNSKAIGDVFEKAFDFSDNKHRFTGTTAEENIFNHQDRKSDRSSVDVKAVKKFKRNDKLFAEDTFMLEYRHIGIDENGQEVYRDGWMFGKQTHLAIGYVSNFDFYFLFFDRAKLADWCVRNGYTNPDKLTIREKGVYAKMSDFNGKQCNWVRDELIWIDVPPENIDGFLGKFCISNILESIMNNPFDEVIQFIKDNNIVLDRSIAFFDLETTGLEVVNSRIVEIGVAKINPDYTIEKFHTLVNPGVHIPDEASGVNNICDDDVKDKPKFADIADQLLSFFGTPKSCDLGGYNILRYDIPLLIEEFKRAGKTFKYGSRRIIDVYNILVKAEPRDLMSVYKAFTGKEIVDAHSALADTAASASIAFRQLGKYKMNSIEELSKFATDGMVDAGGFFRRDKNTNKIVFGIGKFKGRPVLEVYNGESDKSYFDKYIKEKCGADVNKHLELILSGKEV